MELRTGLALDADAIASLIASFQHLLTDSPDGAGAEDYLASVSGEAEARYLASDRFEYVLACDAGEMVGFIAMRDVTHVFHLFVQSACQGRGVASALWREARRRAERRQQDAVYTVNSSLRAIPVYEGWGFQATGPVQRVHGISFLPMSRPSRRD